LKAWLASLQKLGPPREEKTTGLFQWRTFRISGVEVKRGPGGLSLLGYRTEEEIDNNKEEGGYILVLSGCPRLWKAGTQDTKTTPLRLLRRKRIACACTFGKKKHNRGSFTS